MGDASIGIVMGSITSTQSTSPRQEDYPQVPHLINGGRPDESLSQMFMWSGDRGIERVDGTFVVIAESTSTEAAPANLTFVCPRTPLDEIPPICVGRNKSDETRTIVVNGMNQEPEEFVVWAKMYAEAARRDVLPLYNLSKGMFLDTLQASSDRLNILENRTTAALVEKILEAAQEAAPLHLVGHSQGALVISRALFDSMRILKNELTPEGFERFFRGVTVETFGGAAALYPSGPSYIHYVNDGDPVSYYLGVGRCGLSPEEQREVEAAMQVPLALRLSLSAVCNPYVPWSVVHPGEGARIVRVPRAERSTWTQAHGMQEYLKARLDPSRPELFGPETITQAPSAASRHFVAMYLVTGASGVKGTLGAFFSSRKGAGE